MGNDIAVITMKVMPTSPEVDLENLKEEIKKTIEQKGGANKEYSEEPIAFGLKAVYASFRWPEEQDADPVEEAIGNLENVQSVTVTEMRKVE